MPDKINKRVFGFEIENRINVGDVITMVCIFASVVVISFGVWRELYDRIGNNDKRLVVVEHNIVSIQMQAERDRSDIKDDLNEIKEGIKDLSKQVMRKADK